MFHTPYRDRLGLRWGLRADILFLTPNSADPGTSGVLDTSRHGAGKTTHLDTLPGIESVPGLIGSVARGRRGPVGRSRSAPRDTRRRQRIPGTQSCLTSGPFRLPLPTSVNP